VPAFQLSDAKKEWKPSLNFFFCQVLPLQAALWQRRSEPVKVLRLRSDR
jgi:hypothetical protein